MLNPFFQNGTKGEQGLIQSLVNEQLKMYGIEVYYMPRKYLTKFTVIKEVIQSEFDNAYPIEAYVDNYDGYGGEGTILSRFGIQEKDDLTLVVSRERFEEYITPLIKNLPNIELATRPKEGDLIYFPLGERLFEIKYVEHEQPFYQLQKNYVYTLRCELFRYEDEVIDTGIDDIDEEIEQIGHIKTLRLIAVGVSTQATATSSLCTTGSVGSVVVTNMGRGYTELPRVAFSSAPGGTTAVGVASLTYDYVGCDGTSGKIVSVNVTNAGCGYTVAPIITFHGGGPSGAGAAATSILVPTGSVQTVSIANSGGGYITAPTVGISTPKHVGAAATAILNSASVLRAPISIGASAYLFPYGTTGGVYYKQAPTVTFGTPTGGVGTTATGISTIRFDSITTSGTIGIGSTVITGINTTNMVVGDRVRLQTGYDSPYERVYIIPKDTFVTSIGSSILTINNATVGLATTTQNVEVGIQNCGIVTGITVTFGGSGYTSPPIVTISNDTSEKNYYTEVNGVVKATGIATISSAGFVTSIYISNGGAKYVIAPDVTLSKPVAGIVTSSGSFVYNEIVTGGTSGTTARVKEYDAVANTLEISIVSGDFKAGETITGSESSAVGIIRTVGIYDEVTPFADNDSIQREASLVIDFSEKNPFGMP